MGTQKVTLEERIRELLIGEFHYTPGHTLDDSVAVMAFVARKLLEKAYRYLDHLYDCETKRHHANRCTCGLEEIRRLAGKE